MAMAALDTHKLFKHLKEAGFTETQAEALAEAGAELLESRLATKEDLRHLREDLERKIDKMREDLERKIDKVRESLERNFGDSHTELENKIERMEDRMIIKLGGLMVVAVGVVAALVKLL
ncbi:MAG: DUF1640 domain-containing protein [Methylothermaceae bacterium]|nr:DUF1640 domain-containing protein [Methylothermaceae bacterium]